MITPFYSGADLARAATRKGSADSSHGNVRTGRTIRALLRHLAEALKKAPLAACRELTCQGAERHSGRSLSVRYIGTRAQFHFIMDVCFDSYRIVRERRLRSPRQTAGAIREVGTRQDLLFVDTESWLAGLLVRTPGLRVPPWVKQYLEIRDEWSDVLGHLPRATRRGVARTRTLDSMLKAKITSDHRHSLRRKFPRGRDADHNAT